MHTERQPPRPPKFIHTHAAHNASRSGSNHDTHLLQKNFNLNTPTHP